MIVFSSTRSSIDSGPSCSGPVPSGPRESRRPSSGRTCATPPAPGRRRSSVVGRLALGPPPARHRHLAAMPASMQASDEPMAEVPTVLAASGAFHRSAIMCTQRRSISAVCGYSSLSIMFLLIDSAIRPRTSGSSPSGGMWPVSRGVPVHHQLIRPQLVRLPRQGLFPRDLVLRDRPVMPRAANRQSSDWSRIESRSYSPIVHLLYRAPLSAGDRPGPIPTFGASPAPDSVLARPGPCRHHPIRSTDPRAALQRVRRRVLRLNGPPGSHGCRQRTPHSATRSAAMMSAPTS